MYLVDGQRYEVDAQGLERALAEAYEAHIRPLCLCSEPPIQVYITRLGVTFVPKRMPFTGSQHALGCSHYEPPQELSGLGEVSGSAISEDPDTGVTHLRVGFSLSKRGHRSIDVSTGHDSGSVRSDGARLSLRGLLHFLWIEAELTRWRPGFAGKRTWAVVRNHLLNAAQNKIASGSPLSTSLYVPEMFSMERRDEINARRTDRFLRGTLPTPAARRPLLLLIAELKEIAPARFGFKAVIKHVPDQAFALGRQLHRRMSSRFAADLSLWAATDSIHMMMIATFGLNDAGIPALEELSLMPVTAQWIPVDNMCDQLLVERLVREERTFVKLLNIDAPMSASRTSAMLLDAGSSAMPLRVQHPGDERREGPGGDECPAFEESSCWAWNVAQESLPALPMRRVEHRPGVASVDARTARSELRP